MLRYGPLKVQTLPTLSIFETSWKTRREASVLGGSRCKYFDPLPVRCAAATSAIGEQT